MIALELIIEERPDHILITMDLGGSDSKDQENLRVGLLHRGLHDFLNGFSKSREKPLRLLSPLPPHPGPTLLDPPQRG